MASFFDPDHVTPADVLRQLGMRPNKALGQHFLHDRRVVARIVETAGIDHRDDVLEFGPGLGILTSELSKSARRVIAIEKDTVYADYLSRVAPPNVQIINADALETDISALFAGEFKVVANLPYNVGNAIVRHCLESRRRPASMTVMLQLEVARRIVATPPEMSILAVSVQFFGDARFCFRVGRGAFTPPPNVDSAVIRVDTTDPQLPEVDFDPFFRIVRAGFGQRRKQLVNTLATGLDASKLDIASALERAGIDPQRRPETLTIDEWVTLYRCLKVTIL